MAILVNRFKTSSPKLQDFPVYWLFQICFLLLMCLDLVFIACGACGIHFFIRINVNLEFSLKNNFLTIVSMVHCRSGKNNCSR